jgi:hypothetical protein
VCHSQQLLTPGSHKLLVKLVLHHIPARWNLLPYCVF